ncbi:MAG: hypothetical protein DRN37_02020 [Thermoplasmata archaeon]|nr:MAG: hypothetical protein DRN37_02020 [Thermoplasmata archaeon]
MWNLIRLFLLEELRLRRSFSSALSLLVFPEVILLGSMCGYLFLPQMGNSLTTSQIHMGVLGSLFMFGVSMGGIAFLGKEFIERSLGPVTMLAASVSYQPVHEKRMYLAYFLHDLLFYMFLVLGPMTGGLLLGQIVRPMEAGRFLLITAAQWSTFLLGLSLSMLVSSMINRRGRWILLLAPFSMAPLVTVQILTGEVKGFLPAVLSIETGSWAFIILTSLLAVVYTAFGVLLFEGGAKGNRTSSPGSFRRMMAFSRILYPSDHVSRALLAREMLSLVRGKAYLRISFSLLFPLLVISGMIGLISGMEEVPVRFNVTFFAVMISFFTISIYTHLTNMDFLDFDQTLPVDTPRLIRVKVRLYLMLSLPIAFMFLITMSIATGDMKGLLFGLPLVLVAVPYMGFVTAYLTGLWTNSLLFDSSVFMKYMIFTVLPLMFSTILSFLMTEVLLPSIIGIAAIILMGVAAVFIISRGLDSRWKDVPLSSSGSGFRN